MLWKYLRLSIRNSDGFLGNVVSHFPLLQSPDSIASILSEPAPASDYLEI